MILTSAMLVAALQLPVPFCWQFDAPTLTNRTYIADLDYLKANTEAELMLVGPVSGVVPEGNRVFAVRIRASSPGVVVVSSLQRPDGR